MELEKIIGCNIRRLRISKGWSQSKLADIYGCNNKFISLIETGRKWFGKETFNRFCSIFNVESYEMIKMPPKDNLDILWHTIEQLDEHKIMLINKLFNIIFNIKPEQMVLLDRLEHHLSDIINYIIRLPIETNHNNLKGL